MTVLTKFVGQIVVRAKPIQQPPQQPPQQPTPTCAVEIDQVGPGGTQSVRIFGGGFLPSELVNIIEFERIATTTPADQLGSYSVELGVTPATPAVLHTYRAHGQTSSRTSLPAGTSF